MVQGLPYLISTNTVQEWVTPCQLNVHSSVLKLLPRLVKIILSSNFSRLYCSENNQSWSRHCLSGFYELVMADWFDVKHILWCIHVISIFLYVSFDVKLLSVVARGKYFLFYLKWDNSRNTQIYTELWKRMFYAYSS